MLGPATRGRAAVAGSQRHLSEDAPVPAADRVHPPAGPRDSVGVHPLAPLVLLAVPDVGHSRRLGGVGRGE
eukprot:scaffold33041_cov63-Phaeocystis_antarctica.AAC.1